jgi:hypothetical protein
MPFYWFLKLIFVVDNEFFGIDYGIGMAEGLFKLFFYDEIGRFYSDLYINSFKIKLTLLGF